MGFSTGGGPTKPHWDHEWELQGILSQDEEECHGSSSEELFDSKSGILLPQPEVKKWTVGGLVPYALRNSFPPQMNVLRKWERERTGVGKR